MTYLASPSGSGLIPLTTEVKATRGQTRINNLRLALQIIYRDQPASRAHVARESALTPATASDLVDELIAMRLAQEVGTGPSAGGKPPTLVAPHPDGRTIIALDLSGEQFIGAQVNLVSEVVTTMSRPAATGTEGLSTVTTMISELSQDLPGPLLGVGIGTPGVVNPEHGIVTSVNLKWDHVDVVAAAKTVTTAPIHVVNDAHAAAVHEYAVIVPRVPNIALVEIGKGIGSGYVVGGNLYRGDLGATGEIGHIRQFDDTRPCSCGRSGCLEAVASMKAIIEAAGTSHPVTVEGVKELAAESEAEPHIARAAVDLGQALAAAVSVLGITHISLWGPVAGLGESFRSQVEEEIRDRVLPIDTDQIHVRYATAGQDAVILGAAGLVLSAELGVVW
jgi:predicted NBD/HSP70 family sugar kinase